MTPAIKFSDMNTPITIKQTTNIRAAVLNNGFGTKPTYHENDINAQWLTVIRRDLL